jgi:hypothetical protein
MDDKVRDNPRWIRDAAGNVIGAETIETMPRAEAERRWPGIGSDNVERIEVYSEAEINNVQGVGLITAVSLLMVGAILGGSLVGIAWYLSKLF